MLGVERETLNAFIHTSETSFLDFHGSLVARVSLLALVVVVV